VPSGGGWVHELKFDGYRVQAHKMGSHVVLFSRNGHHFTDRFASIAALLREMPVKAAVLNGEVVASDAVMGRTCARSTGQAPGGPNGLVGAFRLPGCLGISDLRRWQSAAACGRRTPP
jgi:hypothetical protein